MSLMSLAMSAVERGLVPDSLTRWGIRRLCAGRAREADGQDCGARQQALQEFLELLSTSPIALVPEKANEQHYELPAEFFTRVLGSRRKYSCCYWPTGVDTLDQAEQAALELTCQRATLADGMEILELGCGWGSLSLWMAERYPRSRITAVSNSATQRQFIESQIAERRLENLQVLTADMNTFAAPGTYDRVVSVEMFEHMRNYKLLLARIACWLKPEGRLFVHIFCHRTVPYEFASNDDDDWIGRYFFSGGIMPSFDLLLHFQRDFFLVKQDCWSGEHYRRTSNAWLRNLDNRRAEIWPLLVSVYGPAEAARWLMRWRLFFLACAELFGFRGGQEWWVGHYLFERRQIP